MKTLLVTGGCGFIGSNFIRFFLSQHSDYRVINLDKLTYAGNIENTRDFQENTRYEFIHGDIADETLLRKIFARKLDGVIHFAAETHVDRSIDDANDFLVTNVLGTMALLEATRLSKVPRFLHISTDEVYGSLEKGEAKEHFPLEPNSPYSAAKAASDLLVRAYWKTYAYPAMIVRSSNNYGPYQFPEKVIPLFITNLIEGKKVPLYGNGKNRREWIFVEDNCRAIDLVFNQGKPGEIYNLGTGHELSNIDLTRTILKQMGFDESFIAYVEDRRGHDFRYAIDLTKIKSLGFAPKWSFEKGLSHTIQWYKENSTWWKPLKKDKFTLK